MHFIVAVSKTWSGGGGRRGMTPDEFLSREKPGVLAALMVGVRTFEVLSRLPVMKWVRSAEKVRSLICFLWSLFSPICFPVCRRIEGRGEAALSALLSIDGMHPCLKASLRRTSTSHCLSVPSSPALIMVRFSGPHSARVILPS